MHPRISELLDHIDGRRADLRAAVNEIPVEHHRQRPTPESWAVSEVLEHLAIVEKRLGRMLAARLTEERAAGLALEHDESPILPTINVSQVLDRSQRIMAPDATHPRGVLDSAAALAALEDTRRDLRAAVLTGDGFALGQVMQPHPVFGPISMYTWIAFVGAHEARHTSQIREIGAQLARR